jgi:hypothetical protein
MTANARASACCGSWSATAVPSSAPAAVADASVAVTAKSGAAPVSRWLVSAGGP